MRQASLDLEWTELRAPVDGRIGDRRVSVGNLVAGGTTGTTLLATIESVDPIRFEFTVDESSYLRYARLAKDKADSTDLGLTVPVKLKLIDETSFSHVGRLDFVDNAINRSTGTIRARAVFANPNRTSRRACSRACRWPPRRRRIRCWCRRPQLAPNRCASS